MKKYLEVSFLISIFLVSFALYASAQQKLFEGTVKDSNNHPVVFAEVKVFRGKQFSRPLLIRTTNDNGHFSFYTDTLKGSFLLQISHVTFDTLQKNIDFNTTSAPMLFRLNKRAVGLKAVNITASKDLIYRQQDKIVMNVEDNPNAIGQNIFNILQLAPGVSVFNSSISINGVPGARIYINGRPLQLSGGGLAGYLGSLKSSDIKSIEIIAHPSAEYDAEGTGGIINVVLKTTAQLGWSGSIGYTQSFGLGKYPAFNPNMGINFKRNGLLLSAHYSYNNQKDFLEMTEERKLRDGSQQNTTTNRIGHYLSNSADISVSYDISKKHSVGLNYNGNYSNSREQMISSTFINFPNSFDNITSEGQFPNQSNLSYNNIGMNYDWKTDTLNSKLSVVVDYTRNKNDAISESNSTTYNYLHQQLQDTLYNFVFPSLSSIWTGELKFNKKFKSGQELIMGGKFTTTAINTDNTYNIFTNNAFQVDNNRSFEYRYREKIAAAFLQTAGKFVLFDYKAGLRLENSYVEGLLSQTTASVDNIRRYLNLFPYLYLGRKLDKKGKNIASLSYNRRITRPSYSALNPFSYFIDNYTIISGNPNLKPSYIDVVDLGYTLNQKYALSISYNSIKNQINQVLETDSNSNITTIIRSNLGSTKLFNANFSIPIQIEKWWTTNNTLLLQHVEIEAPQFNIDKSTYRLQSNHLFKVSPLTTVSVSGFYTPHTIYGNTITGEYSNISIGIRQRLLKKKLIVGANIYDLLEKNNPRLASYYNNDVIKRYQKFQTRLLVFSLVYNFKIGKAFQTKDNERSNEDEKNRL
ncbi:TonB-dependent receptor [Mucilaginibacter sp. Bleaf8]|uniref:outer membrane beta-barrel protein n=1 Tax=Mucilaginibacter sp. Bleaf8 TaxID=2834430 RepID=UPI001BD01CB1|nr:outer membrane beta-barrel protein [Mucilaginibacter sp. Bleaf8]MBS7565719.1 TonB-dependent receptor [Mucilaginibacter sp. Bleaf8]